MRLTKSRMLRLIAAIAIVGMLVPVTSAPAYVAKEAGTIQHKYATVRTHVSRNFIRVSVLDLPKDVTGIDIYRSTAKDVLGVKLNDKPVSGATYKDSAVVPGTTYFYTVKIASRDAKTSPGRFVAMQTLDQVSAKSYKPRAARAHEAAKSRPKLARLSRPKVKVQRMTSSITAAVTRAMSSEIGTAGEAYVLPTSQTWTTAMSPILVRSDIVVPAGRTLTIDPGVTVYFDTAPSGDTSDYPSVDATSVSGQIDLIVHGKLIANGTSTAPIILTSIRSLPESAAVDGLPSNANWGVVFNDSRAASTISYCRIEYGSGLYSRNTARPYLTNNVIRNSWSSSPPWGAIGFLNPTTDSTTPRVTITGNQIASGNEGILIYAVDGAYGLEQTSDLIVDPLITNNNIRSSYPIDLEAWDDNALNADVNAYVRGTVSNNTMRTNSDEIELWAQARGAKTGKVTTAFSGNKIVSDDDYGVYAYAGSTDYGKGYCNPTFNGDVIDSYDQTVYAEAYSNTDTDAVGGAYVDPHFTNCKLTSTGDDGVYAYARSYNKGPAEVNPVFTNGTVETADCEGVDAAAYSAYGAASASPSFTNVDLEAHDACEAIYAEAYSYSDGTTKVNPRFVGGTMLASDDYAVYAYSQSASGTAEAKPYVTDAKISSYDEAIYAEAYGSNNGNGNGAADASFVCKNCDVRVVYDYGSAFYAEASAEGSGGAGVCSPQIVNDTVDGYFEDGLDTYAYSNNGSAMANPVITDTTLDAWGYGAYVYAERDTLDSAISGNAVASPVITDSYLRGGDSEALDTEAYNDGTGDAIIAPTLSESTFYNNYGEGGWYAESDKEGSAGDAKLIPTADNCMFRGSDDDSLEMYVYGSGVSGSKAIFGGSFNKCNLDNPYYDSIGSDVYNYGGSASFTTQFQGCSMQALDDYAVDADVYGSGDETQTLDCSPRFVQANASKSGDGFWLEAYTDDGSASCTVNCSPRFVASKAYATWDDSIFARARTAGHGTAKNGAYLYNNKVKGYDGMYLDAIVNNGGDGTAINTSRVLGVSSSKMSSVESMWDNCLSQRAMSDNGPAINASQARNLNIDGYLKGLRIQSYAGGSATGTLNPTITGNVVGTKWMAYDEGILVRGASGATFTAAPTISGNTINGIEDSGIYFVPISSTAVKTNPVITNNKILDVNGTGIYVQTAGAPVDGSALTISGNTIARPTGLGINIQNTPYGLVQANKIDQPGWKNDSGDPWSVMGILWSGADASSSPTGAQVRGNMVTNARVGVGFSNGWATMQYNSLGNVAGNTDAPWNLMATKDASPTPMMDAQHNWWASGTPGKTIYDSTVATVSDAIDYSHALPSVQPKVSSIAKSKSGSTYTFKVTFDRPMNTAITSLTFGKTSPFKTYKTKTGTWNSAGTVLTVKFTGTLPFAHYFFAGATDLPGNAMLSTTKYFVP